MSANINILDENKRKRILMVAANQGLSSTTGWPIGFWWAELTHPYFEFVENGYEVEIISPKGGDLFADGYSDPEDASGYSAHDLISLGFKKSPKHSELIKNTKSIKDVKISDYDALFLAGRRFNLFGLKKKPRNYQILISL